MKQDKFDQLDLFEVFYILWGKKYKIMGFILISVLLMFVYQFFSASSSTVITEIKPISISQAQQYRLLNAEYSRYKIENKDNEHFRTITASSLLDIFIQKLKEGDIFRDVIHNLKLLDLNEYKDQNAYDIAVEKLVSKIKFIPPTNLTDKKKNKDTPINPYWLIEFETTNTEKWKQILSAVNIKVNQDLQMYLEQRFKTSILIMNMGKKNKINDIQIDIKNSLADYDKTISKRLAFLNEQSKIARKLDISKNTLQTENFETKNNIVSNIQTDTPFYMNGYLSIEEEIRLIDSRDDKSLFIKNLLKLEQNKRALEQDQTLSRITNLFSLTPIVKNNDKFAAAYIKTNTTKTISKNKMLGLLLAFLVGGFIGVIYTLFPAINPKQNK